MLLVPSFHSSFKCFKITEIIVRLIKRLPNAINETSQQNVLIKLKHFTKAWMRTKYWLDIKAYHKKDGRFASSADTTVVRYYTLAVHEYNYKTTLLASVAQLDARPTGDQRSWVRPPRRGRQHSFVEIWSWNSFYGYSFPSADSRRQLSVSGERMWTILINRLVD